MARKNSSSSNPSGDSSGLFARVMIAMLVLVLLVLAGVFLQVRDLFYRILLVTMDLGLVASLIANFFLYRKIRILKAGPPPPPAPKRAKAPARAPAPKLTIDPKLLPDPGLVYRFDMTKDTSRRIVIGQTDGTIKTYSTEILDNHLEVEIRVKSDDQQDIYDQSQAIRQRYQLDFRRGGRVMIYYPGQERFREMDARERIVVQPEPDSSGDFQYANIEPKNPIRFQLGDRLRHDGKFLKGYIEFHLFTKETETEVSGYKRLDKMFFLRIFKIFPGYDTAHPDEDGLYPMIDPFISR